MINAALKGKNKMKTKFIASAAATAALAAVVGLGGLTSAQTSAQATTPLPTPPAATTTPATPDGHFGQGRGGHDGRDGGNFGSFGGNFGGDGGLNFRRGGGATQQGSARLLNEVYEGMVRYNAATNAPQLATQLFTQAKAVYETAITDYNAATYGNASRRAAVSASALHAAQAVTQAERGAATLSGVTAPPAVTGDNAQQRSNHSLQQAYAAINAAQAVVGQAGSEGAAYLAAARNYYTEALTNFSSNDYTATQQNAHAASALSNVIRHLAALTSVQAAPNLPAPPPSVQS